MPDNQLEYIHILKFIFNLPFIRSTHQLRTVVYALLVSAPVLFLCPGLSASEFDHPTGSDYILENDNITVVLNRDMPSVKYYLLKENGGVIIGNPDNAGPDIFLCRGVERVSGDQFSVVYTSNHSDRMVSYHAVVSYEDKPAVEFDLFYLLTGRQVEIKFGHIVENENFYLVYIHLPGLVTVKDGETSAKLAIPAEAGRLIDIARAEPKDYEYEIDWLNPILSGFAYHSRAIGILDTRSIENHTIASIHEITGIRCGSLSMKLFHRLIEYDLEEFGPKIQATDPKNFLKVQDSCSITITIAGDYDNDGEVNWIDGTKILREHITAVPNPYYSNKTFVRTFVDRPPTGEDPTGTLEELKFDDVLQRIKDFAVQTDSAAYIMYLLGWQYEGHDSGFPSVDKVNDNLGGYERLVNLIKEAGKYNVNVTFHDNYDDSYPTHPGWDPDVICRDPQGNFMKGGVWEGNQSYLISSYKYAIKSGLDRVRFTLEKYPVQDAYFIDVLAGGYNGGRKYDFNPESPAGAQKNLEGKLMIIEEFNRNGLDVATEDFTGFFVGHVGTFGDIIALDNVNFRNEEEIPLIPFMYHGKTSFGMKISDPSQKLKTLLYGQRAQKFTNLNSVFTPADYILDALPRQKLYGKIMTSYTKKADTEQVIYEDGSRVEINLKEDKYTVTMGDGITIARDYTSFVPMEKDVFMACSRDGGSIHYPVPAGWKVMEKIRAFKIGADGSRTHVEFRISDGNLEFKAEPKIPYKIVYQ